MIDKNQASELDLFTKNRVKIALPLKPQPDCELNPEPNFLIMENIWTEDYIYKAMFPPNHPSAVMVECARARMRLVYREMLPADEYKPTEMREVIFDEMGTLDFPEEYIGLFNRHDRAIKSETLINSLLAMFQFRGCLKGYKLEYDAAKSQKFLDYYTSATLNE